MSAGRGIVHEAAAGHNGKGQQRCVMCGKVLADNGPDITRPMGVERAKPMWWSAGPVTELDGGSQWVAGAEAGAEPCVKLEPQ